MTDGPATGPVNRPKPAPRKRRALPWVILLLLAVFIGGVVAAPRIMAALPAWMTGKREPEMLALVPAAPAAPLPAPVEDTDSLKRRLAALESEVTRLRGEAAQEGVTSETVTTMGLQVSQLANQMAEQQARLRTLEESSPQAMVKPMAVLAVSRLRQAVEQGSSYAGALDGVEHLVADAGLPEAAKTALLTLGAHKQQGVVSALALREAFAPKIDDIIDAEAAPADASWWDKTLARLENMVTVRPTGDVKGGDAPAITARAEAALDRGEVDKAVGELQALSPPAAVAAADWLQEAQTRQAVLGAIDTLETALLEKAAGVEAKP